MMDMIMDMHRQSLIMDIKCRKREWRMSDAKICDRCGQTIKLFENKLSYQDEAWRYEIIKDCHPYPDKIKIDLCSDCKKDLKRWLGRKGR